MHLRLILLTLFLLFGLNNLFAVVSYRLEDFETGGSRMQVGVVSYEQRAYYKLGISPDLRLGRIGFGFDLNLFIPTEGNENVPIELNSFAFRLFSYEDPDHWGLNWGRLTNITFGRGLLLDKYDSGSAGSSEFTTIKAGLDAHYNPDPYKFRILYTATNLRAIRTGYTLVEDPLFGQSIELGLTHVEDLDGVFDGFSSAGVDRIRPKVSGSSIDLTMPIYYDLLYFYTEIAQLHNHGRGAGIGLGGAVFNYLDYRLEYRSLGAGFVPGYFNNTYEVNNREANTFDFSTDAPQKETVGWVAYTGFSLFHDYIKAEFVYEDYEKKDPILSAALGWHQIGPTVGVINYSKSFQNSNGGIASASILYQNMLYLPMPTDVIFTIHRVYSDFGDFNNPDNYTETVTITFRPSLRGVFPFLM